MFRSSSGACALLLFNEQLRSTTARAQQLIAVTKRLYTAIARRRRWPYAYKFR